MSLLFMDGFDHYATADITKKWDTAGTYTINAASGRRSGGALVGSFASAELRKAFTANASVVFGFAFKVSVIDTTTIIASLTDSGSQQIELRLNNTGTLSLTRAGTALTGGTSTNVITANTYNYIEVKATISSSIAANSCKVRVNGADWITVATGQSTKNTANSTTNGFWISYTGGSATANFDDLYLCDQSGSKNNDFLGDCRVDALYPTSDGNYSQFTPSTGTSHYQLVDETPPNTTDYNSSSTLNQLDTYGMGDLPTTPATIYGVQVNLAALKDDAGTRGISPVVRSGSVDSVGIELALSTGQLYARAIYENDPNTSTAWTATTVNAAEVGAKITT